VNGKSFVKQDMRVIISLFLAALLLSCKKEEKSNSLYESYSGIWEYEKHIGMFTDSLPPGNGRIMDLGSNGSFESRQHDSIIFKGIYILQEKADCSLRAENVFFSTSDTAFVRDGYIALKNGKLTVTTSNCLVDGGTTFYRKVGSSNN
jgi:hypothetical protein